jgi:RHS repeat-associated protein
MNATANAHRPDSVTRHHNRYYNPAIGRWLSEDPIGFAAGDVNLNRFVGNAPTNAIDPTGQVEFAITPDKVPSMEWHSSKLGGKGKVGETRIAHLSVPWKAMGAGCDGGGKLSFTVTADLQIHLDLDELAKQRRVSRATAYGHEQVHVANMITIFKREAKIFEEVEEKTFYDKDVAKTAAEQAIKKFETAVHAAYKIDQAHLGKDPKSPPAGAGVPAQGKMPISPKKPEAPKGRK